MKLGPVTKLDKKNKASSKNCDDNFTLANWDIIVSFLIFGQFGAISLIVTIYLTETENKSEGSLA